MDSRTNTPFNANEINMLEALKTILAEEKLEIASLTLTKAESEEKKADKITKINKIRQDLHTALEMATQEKHRQLIHACLINLTRYWPINTECFITAEKIKNEDKIFSESGHQYNATSIQKWLKTKNLNLGNNKPFSPRDLAYIKHQLTERRKKLSPQNERKHTEETQVNLPLEVESHTGKYTALGAAFGAALGVALPIAFFLTLIVSVPVIFFMSIIVAYPFLVVRLLDIAGPIVKAGIDTSSYITHFIGFIMPYYTAIGVASLLIGACVLGAVAGLIYGLIEYNQRANQLLIYSRIANELDAIDKNQKPSQELSSSNNYIHQALDLPFDTSSSKNESCLNVPSSLPPKIVSIDFAPPLFNDPEITMSIIKTPIEGTPKQTI